MFGRNRNPEAFQTENLSADLPDGSSREDLLRYTADSYSLMGDGSYLPTKTYRTGSVPIFPESGTQHERNLITVHNGTTHLFKVASGLVNGRPQQGYYHYAVPPREEGQQERTVTVSAFTPWSEGKGDAIGVPEGGYVKEVVSDGGTFMTIGADQAAEVARIDGFMADMTAEQRNEMHVVAVTLETVHSSMVMGNYLPSAA